VKVKLENGVLSAGAQEEAWMDCCALHVVPTMKDVSNQELIVHIRANRILQWVKLAGNLHSFATQQNLFARLEILATSWTIKENVWPSQVMKYVLQTTIALVKMNTVIQQRNVVILQHIKDFVASLMTNAASD